MTYEQIKKKINEDYSRVISASTIIGGRHNMKTHYMSFFRALESLNEAVGPFVLNKEQFIEYIKNMKESTPPDVYSKVIDYCHDSLKLEI